MQTATSETESKFLDLSICVNHSSLRATCPQGQGIVEHDSSYHDSVVFDYKVIRFESCERVVLRFFLPAAIATILFFSRKIGGLSFH